MTETVLKEIVHRAVRDGSYRAQLQRDPAAALAGYALSGDERSALTTGDAAKLTALGIDQRMSKAFTIGLTSEASKVIVVDAGVGDAVVDEAAQTVRSFNWMTEQNIDALAMSASPEAAFDATGLREVERGGTSDAATVDQPATERSFNWTVEQNIDAGDSLKTVDWPGEDDQAGARPDNATTQVPDMDQNSEWDGNTLTEY